MLIKLPFMVIVDNIGAMFMASNITIMSCIMHMDIRYKYAYEYVEDSVGKIMFVSLMIMTVTFSPKT